MISNQRRSSLSNLRKRHMKKCPHTGKSLVEGRSCIIREGDCTDRGEDFVAGKPALPREVEPTGKKEKKLSGRLPLHSVEREELGHKQKAVPGRETYALQIFFTKKKNICGRESRF